MPVNDHTLDVAKRTLYYESEKRGILLPYSKLVIDSVEYLEMNAHVTKELPKEGGGTHATPGTGVIDGIEYVPRMLGISSSSGSTGTTRAQPPNSVIHRAGWI